MGSFYFNLSAHSDFYRGFHPTHGLAQNRGSSSVQSGIPTFCYKPTNYLFFNSSYSGTLKIYRNSTLQTTISVSAMYTVNFLMTAPFYNDIIELNYSTSATSPVNSNFGIIASLAFLNESNVLEYITTNEFWICNHAPAVTRAVGNNDENRSTYFKIMNVHTSADWIWDQMNRNYINCQFQIRNTDIYLTTAETCP